MENPLFFITSNKCCLEASDPSTAKTSSSLIFFGFHAATAFFNSHRSLRWFKSGDWSGYTGNFQGRSLKHVLVHLCTWNHCPAGTSKDPVKLLFMHWWHHLCQNGLVLQIIYGAGHMVKMQAAAKHLITRLTHLHVWP